MSKVVNVARGRASPQRLHPSAATPPLAWLGIATVVLAFGGVGGWAALAPLASAVVAPGVVSVDANRKTVQHLEGGIVRDILVRDGDEVEAGQPLIVLTDERVDASLEVLMGQLLAAQAKAARLQAERDGHDTVQFPAELTARTSDPQTAAIIDSERAYFEASRALLNEQLQLLATEREHVAAEVDGLTQQVAAEERAADFVRQEIAKNQSLERKQFVQETQILALKRLLEDYLSRRGEHLGDAARARQKALEIDLKRTALRAERIQKAADGLTVAKAEIYDIQERLRPSRDAQVRQRIVAPLGGTVVDLKVHTIGGVIGPREPLMDIVPHEQKLIVAAHVDVNSIDNVRPGMECDVRLTAYKTRTTPLVPCTITYLSADRLEETSNHAPYYLAHADFDMDAVRRDRIDITAGMSAELYIKTRSRTAIEYLMEPLTVFLRRSVQDN